MAKPNNLKKCREEAGLSKAALARSSDVSEATIRNIESCKRDASPSTKHKLVSGLNKSNHKQREYKFEEVFP